MNTPVHKDRLKLAELTHEQLAGMPAEAVSLAESVTDRWLGRLEATACTTVPAGAYSRAPEASYEQNGVARRDRPSQRQPVLP